MNTVRSTQNTLNYGGLGKMKRPLFRYVYDNLEVATIIVCFSLMVVITGFTVFSRYLFAFTFSWAEQATRIFFVIITFAGISQAAKTNAHLKVTALLIALPKKISGILVLFGDLASAIFAAVMSWEIFKLVLLQFRQKQTFAAIPGLPVWVMYLPGTIFLALFAVRIVQYGLLPEIRRQFGKESKGGEDK